MLGLLPPKASPENWCIACIEIYFTCNFVNNISVAVTCNFVNKCSKRNANLTAQEPVLPLGTWRRLSYRELERATNGFSERNLPGTGSFGLVYEGKL